MRVTSWIACKTVKLSRCFSTTRLHVRIERQKRDADWTEKEWSWSDRKRKTKLNSRESWNGRDDGRFEGENSIPRDSLTIRRDAEAADSSQRLLLPSGMKGEDRQPAASSLELASAFKLRETIVFSYDQRTRSSLFEMLRFLFLLHRERMSPLCLPGLSPLFATPLLGQLDKRWSWQKSCRD